MYFVKFAKPKWKHAAVSGRSVQIGSVLYYREINDPTFRDESEGEGEVVYKSKVALDAETHNRIFSGDGFKLNKDWSIDTNGCPLISQKSNFNPFIYSCSLVHKKKEIKDISKKFRISSYYYINDIWAFVDSVSEGLRSHLQNLAENDSNFTMPEEARKKFANLELLPIMGKIKYTNESKEIIVNEKNSHNFNPMTFRAEPYFQKPKSFSEEKEFRIIWIPNLGSIANEEFDISTTNIKKVHLSLSCHGLSTRPKYIKEVLNKRGARIV